MPGRGCHLGLLGSAFGSVAAWEHHDSLSGSCSSQDRGQGTYFHSESTGSAAAFPAAALAAHGHQERERPLPVAELGSIYTSVNQPKPTLGRSFWNGNILPLYWKSNLWQQNSTADVITFVWLAKQSRMEMAIGCFLPVYLQRH